ncbi:hypothetical protein D3C80_2191750 [compost metagenome]
MSRLSNGLPSNSLLQLPALITSLLAESVRRLVVTMTPCSFELIAVTVSPL